MNFQAFAQPAVSTQFWLQLGLTFFSPGHNVAVHHHHCFQVVFSLGSCFNAAINDVAVGEVSGLFINQQVPHSCQALGRDVLVQYVEPESYWGAAIRKLLDGRPHIAVEDAFPDIDLQQILPANYRTMGEEDLVGSVEKLMRFFFQTASTDLEQDERVGRMLAFAEQHIDEQTTLVKLAAVIHLSPERARHLFAEKVGMPFSQYMLWKRIRAVASAVTQGISISAACKDFGFTDLGHFTRIFRRMFGVPPGDVLLNCKLIL